MGRRVLIVEDEAIHAMAIADSIERWGGTVAGVVDSGEEAVRAAGDELPDVVLMDINIQGATNGLGAARQIIATLRIPVIFMSGYDDEATVAAAEALKPLAFLVKPVDAEQLRKLLSLP